MNRPGHSARDNREHLGLATRAQKVVLVAGRQPDVDAARHPAAGEIQKAVLPSQDDVAETGCRAPSWKLFCVAVGYAASNVCVSGSLAVERRMMVACTSASSLTWTRGTSRPTSQRIGQAIVQ